MRITPAILLSKISIINIIGVIGLIVLIVMSNTHFDPKPKLLWEEIFIVIFASLIQSLFDWVRKTNYKELDIFTKIGFSIVGIIFGAFFSFMLYFLYMKIIYTKTFWESLLNIVLFSVTISIFTAISVYDTQNIVSVLEKVFALIASVTLVIAILWYSYHPGNQMAKGFSSMIDLFIAPFLFAGPILGLIHESGQHPNLSKKILSWSNRKLFQSIKS